jgi:GNAT superfamily N-acetyltransferase
MHIITPTSDLSANQQSIFMQGASYLLVQDDLQVGVWLEHTPDYAGASAVTIGACILEGIGASDFLKDCISHIRKMHPNRPILGPMNGNTWMKHRLIIESNQRPAFLMEPMEPASLIEVFKAAGFAILSQYSSSVIDLTEVQPSFERVEEIVAKQGIEIRPIDMENFESDLNRIYELSLAAFSNNFLYTPLPRQAFMQSYISMKDRIDPEFVLLAFKGEILIGFLFCMPDLDPSVLIVKTLATSPDHRTTGLGTLLVAQVHQRAREKGYSEAIHALQYESNSSLRISQRFKAVRFRTYGLMIIQ